jgi:hydroxymethylpyrimidine pyrophosphatase-like HAD family hydrolase
MSKIFLFSDLDDTFIQNRDKNDFEKENYIASFNRDGEPLDYIYREKKEFLDRIVNSGLFQFVPVTYRNMESYSRTIFHKDYNFDHIILNFGGTLLYKNNLDIHWQTKMNSLFFKLPIKIYDLLQMAEREFFEKLDNRFLPEIRNIDNQYLSIRDIQNENSVSQNLLVEVTNFFNRNGLNRDFYLYKSGDSFAIVPKFLNKRDSVQYIIDRYKPSFTLGAGDNLSDLSFLNLADFSLIPKDSTLNKIMNNYIGQPHQNGKREYLKKDKS